MFETAQRALARQRRAALPASLELARQQRQQGIAPQLVVVIEILVSQSNARDPLRHQRPLSMAIEKCTLGIGPRGGSEATGAGTDAWIWSPFMTSPLSWSSRRPPPWRAVGWMDLESSM